MLYLQKVLVYQIKNQLQKREFIFKWKLFQVASLSCKMDFISKRKTVFKVVFLIQKLLFKAK
jgi:hypothetical protein